MKNLQVTLARRPQGWVQETDFAVVQRDLPALSEGQILVKTLFLSLDPYMRSRMDDAKSYAAKVEIGDVMVGNCVSEVMESRHPKFAVGQKVSGFFGWQEYAISDGTGLRRLDGSIPLTAYLGILGMPGITAWIGMNDIAQPKPGETVVVSAAAGAVGGVAGQIARLKGCRVVGIAGGPAKCAYVKEELKMDHCVDYKSSSFAEDLKAAVPGGVDVYYENVGGPVGEAVMRRMNDFGRIPLCGVISQYNSTEKSALPDPRLFLTRRLKLQGFIVTDHPDRWGVAGRELAGWFGEGKIRSRETIAKGLVNAPQAFIGLLKGENIGKQLVQVALD